MPYTATTRNNFHKIDEMHKWTKNLYNILTEDNVENTHNFILVPM